MGNVFTLDSLREEVEREFAPVQIELADGTVITLRHLLRLPKATRDKVIDTLKALETEDDAEQDVDGMIDAATAVLKMVADQGTRLVKELDGDVTLTMRVLERWMKTTQPGEATTSDS